VGKIPPTPDPPRCGGGSGPPSNTMFLGSQECSSEMASRPVRLFLLGEAELSYVTEKLTD